MIGLILGTSEGKKILSLLNNFTEDIFVSCTTDYGADLLKGYRFSVINKKPLNYLELVNSLKENKISLLIDSSHPYAVEITKNAMMACEELGIQYLRFERKSLQSKYNNYKNIVNVEDYSQLADKLTGIKGTILNTTGSRALNKILGMKLNNRIVHRVLPTEKVIRECISYNIAVDDIIAMKGPFSLELNIAFIKQFKAEAMILKDSGEAGGTEEKIIACFETGINAFMISREKLEYKKIFEEEEKLVTYIRDVF